MTDLELLRHVTLAKEQFGGKCKKVSGAMTVEWLRRALAQHGIPTSDRDVYIRGVPIEIDLLVPRPGAHPELGLIFEPDDAAVALEVKAGGIFGQGALEKTRSCLTSITQRAPGIEAAYVTLTERHGYRWAATSEVLGFRAYTLFYYRGSGSRQQFEPTGDWDRLLRFVKSRLTSLSNRDDR